MQTLAEIAEVIKRAKGVTIFTHTRPDGDTFGCGVALYFALIQLNIPVEICNDSEIPEKFLFLHGMEKITKAPALSSDTCVAVDCADTKRLGMLEDEFLRSKKKKTTVNIDHHISNTLFAQYNYVRPMSANCQNMAELMPLLGVTITPEIANALLMGLLTDSGNFSHSDVDGDTFRAAGALLDCGADVNEIGYHMFRKQSKARAALYGAAMSAIRYLLGDRLAIVTVTKEMLLQAGAVASDTEGFVDFPLSVDSVEVAIALLEVKPRQYKVSLRSKGKVNVNAIAGVFGGGGHILASGCMLFGEIEEVIDKLRYTVSQYMD